jgi:hypothetical protein
MSDQIKNCFMRIESEYEKMTVYTCANCGFTGARNVFNDIRDAYLRFEPGDTYTDAECMTCGAMAFPRWVDIPKAESATPTPD